MADVKWIKLSTDIFDDEKIDFIQSLPEGDSLFLIWIRLLIMAGKCNANGYIFITENIPYTEETLSYKFKKSVNLVKVALQTFQNLNMIEVNDKGIELTNWFKYQNLEGLDKIKEKEQARIRKQRQRDKAKQIEAFARDEVGAGKELSSDSHSDVTGDPSIIDIELDKDKEGDKDTEIKGEGERDINRDIDQTDLSFPYQQIVDKFNEICRSLPKVTILAQDRKKSIIKAWVKFNNVEAFEKLFKKAEESNFLSGRNEKWQGCNFDWLIAEVNMVKTLEGNYDNKKGNSGLGY